MPKILIADDSRFHLTLLDRELKARGFEVIAAEDALQASRLALRAQPAAVILDVSMPGGSGLTVLKRLKQSAKTKSIPVVMLTANQEAETREMAISMGASEFLQKPVNLDQLALKLSDLVKLTSSIGRSEEVVPTPSSIGARDEVLPCTVTKPLRSWRQILRALDEEDRK